jgi:hypothetical protein
MVAFCGKELRDNRSSSVTLAFAMNLAACRTGGILNFYTTAKLVDHYGIVKSTWLVTAIAILPTSLGGLYLVRSEILNKSRSDKVESFWDTVRRLPGIYWSLLTVCITGFACISPFANSVQRFLANWYFDGDEKKAGSQEA